MTLELKENGSSVLVLERSPRMAYSPAWSCTGSYVGDYDAVSDARAAGARYWRTSIGVLIDLDNLRESLAAAIVEDYHIT